MTNVTPHRAFEPAAAAVMIALAAAPALAGGEDRPVRGWLEHAHIEPSGISLDAKLDTGARTSSIHAEILREPEAVEAGAPAAPAAETNVAEAASAPAGGGENVEIVEDDREALTEAVEVEGSGEQAETIVFRITNEQGESSTLQRTILRYVEIKNGDGSSERRPVVEITACLAGVWVSGEVNLADREELNYPFLVGRNMLEASGIIVDSREIYTRSARCADPAP
jgi:hypothetical protein